MDKQVIGSCSICGGDVYGHVGAWMGVQPRPPAFCASCGALEQRAPIIPMRAHQATSLREFWERERVLQEFRDSMKSDKKP